MQILLAEDNRVNQLLVTKQLARRGHEVTVAESGPEALAAFCAHAYDLVLMDLQLPELSGLDATAAIRRAERGTGRHVPIVAVTAHAEAADREACLAAGMDAYLVKPLHPTDLHLMITELTSRRAPDNDAATAPPKRGEALGEIEEGFRTLSEAMPQMVWMTRADGWNIYCNQRWVDYTGLSVEESCAEGWHRPFHPEDLPLATDAWAEAARTHRAYEVECRLRKADGNYHWMLIRGVPLRDKQGRLTRWLGTCTDVHELRQALEAARASEAERKRLDAKLLHAHKLESIGQLAAGIAHEINTPTQYISDNTNFLQKAFTGLLSALASCRAVVDQARAGAVDESTLAAAEAAIQKARLDVMARQVPRAIEQSLDGLSRVSNIVSAMKEFSHPSAGEMRPANLADVVKTTLAVARVEWKYVADAVTDFDPALPLIPCLRDELSQVLLNLVVNAAHAIAAVTRTPTQKGLIHVSTRLAGDFAELRVRDDGAGIAEEIQGRVFDPFFTTKPVGQGTGQGLAIAYSVVVEKHGGTITFETEVGRGTTFLIRLPMGGNRNTITPTRG
jgi:PAS domain S-box-containing protein